MGKKGGKSEKKERKKRGKRERKSRKKGSKKKREKREERKGGRSEVLNLILRRYLLKGRLLPALGQLLASLGCFWDVSWAFLARSWLSLGSAGTVQRRILAPRIVPGFDFNGSGDAPDWVLMNFWDMFCFALRCTSHFVT